MNETNNFLFKENAKSSPFFPRLLYLICRANRPILFNYISSFFVRRFRCLFHFFFFFNSFAFAQAHVDLLLPNLNLLIRCVAIALVERATLSSTHFAVINASLKLIFVCNVHFILWCLNYSRQKEALDNFTFSETRTHISKWRMLKFSSRSKSTKNSFVISFHFILLMSLFRLKILQKNSSINLILAI